MMIPNDSNYPPAFSLTVSETIDALSRMLLSTSMTYEKESCQALLKEIKRRVALTPHIKSSLDTLEKVVQNPQNFESFAIQQALSFLRGCLKIHSSINEKDLFP